jgi:nucleoside-diphosphate-sugar epimerase
MSALRGARVVVLGGAGFVGSQLVRDLRDEGATVTVFDDLSAGDAEHVGDLEDVRLVVGSILDEAELTRVCRAARPDYLVNLVADTFVPDAYDDPRRFLRINAEGTLNVLLAAGRLELKRMLHVSSTEVYGEVREGAADESHRLDPVNTYAVTKLAADRLCFTFHAEHGVPVLIARVFNSYGPRATHPYVIPEIISQLVRGPVVELGNVEARRDFTYVEDTSRGLMAALTSTLPNGEAVNVGSGTSVSVRELVELVGSICDHPAVEIRRDPARQRRFDVHEFVCDATRLHAATGWKPRVSLREGLERTVQAFRAAGGSWIWERRTATAGRARAS